MIIDGKKEAAALREEIKKEIISIKSKTNKVPGLTVILIGEFAPSLIYVRNKEKNSKEVGINSNVIKYSNDVKEEEVLKKIRELNKDKNVSGILVQLPLPDQIDKKKIINSIDPSKDVDGFTPTNVGKLFLGEDTLVSCTPKGIMQMLASTGTDLSGKNVTVVGRSNIVGKPVAILCLQENATVTMCHSRTKDLNAKLSDADVIIVAVGIPKFIHGDQIPDNCIVIDVGIHNIDGKLCGDVDFESASLKASAITPVPGGVGPMTVCALIENTILAAERIG